MDEWESLVVECVKLYKNEIINMDTCDNVEFPSVTN